MEQDKECLKKFNFSPTSHHDANEEERIEIMQDRISYFLHRHSERKRKRHKSPYKISFIKFEGTFSIFPSNLRPHEDVL